MTPFERGFKLYQDGQSCSFAAADASWEQKLIRAGWNAGARVNASRWHSTPPTQPGTYEWRRTWQWESIHREIPPNRRIFSERYCKEVPVETLGGEWFY